MELCLLRLLLCAVARVRHLGMRPLISIRGCNDLSIGNVVEEASKMGNDSAKGRFSRRGFLGISSAALATVAGGLAVSNAMAQEGQQAGNARTDPSTTDPGPTNASMDAQNPDSASPPGTDSKSLVPTFKYPFSFANKRAYKGGWSREVTVRELPVSKTMAGVNMRLTAGGVRELHWHTAAECSIMLYGTARITAIDADGKSFVADVEKDDLWYFPTGIPHSIQGLEPDGAEFMLVFDDGDFSESGAVLLSDWMAHTPKEVLAKNFGVPESAFARIPEKDLWIFQTNVPGPLSADRIAGAGPVPNTFSHRMMAQEPICMNGGTVRITDSSVFKVSKTIAAALVEVEP